jgi:hypothetical protein
MDPILELAAATEKVARNNPQQAWIDFQLDLWEALREKNDKESIAEADRREG